MMNTDTTQLELKLAKLNPECRHWFVLHMFVKLSKRVKTESGVKKQLTTSRLGELFHELRGMGHSTFELDELA